MFLSARKRKILYLKLVKQSGSPDFIARGVALGFFTGLLIPFGGQMIIAIILSFIFKASKIPALACTWITNPWSIPFIYPFQCWLGAKLMGKILSFEKINQNFQNFLHECAHGTFKSTLDSFFNMGADIFIPFFVGGAFLGIIFGVSSYFASYGMIISYHNKKDKKLQKRLAKFSEKNNNNTQT
jgi:uncharacterized protein (DUF2062 family)